MHEKQLLRDFSVFLFGLVVLFFTQHIHAVCFKSKKKTLKKKKPSQNLERGGGAAAPARPHRHSAPTEPPCFCFAVGGNAQGGGGHNNYSIFD